MSPVVRRILASVLAAAFYGALVFGSAWTLDLPRVWLFIAFNFAAGIVNTLVVHRANPDLLAHRLAPKADTRPEDLRLLKWSGALTPVLLVTVGVDLGHLRLVDVPWSVSLAALALTAGTLAVATWAMTRNPHFETTIRIQHDRGHRVVDSGPYAIVRHPGYAMGVVGILLQPLVPGSVLGLVPALAAAVLIVVRARLEDGILREHLAGYAEYAERVRWRMVPGIW